MASCTALAVPIPYPLPITADIFQDLLGVSDLEVWRYGQAVRKLGKEHGCSNIKFIRLVDLLQQRDLTEPLSEVEYLRAAPRFRDELYRTYIPHNFDVDTYIANEKDALLTYRGYLKFLEIDLEESNGPSCENMSKAQKKKSLENVAKMMIQRGKVSTKCRGPRTGMAEVVAGRPPADYVALNP